MSTSYRQAFEEHVYLPHKDAIYRRALRKLGSESAAEDIVQEVFVRAFQGLATVSSAAKVPEWLNRIAENVIADHYRDRYMQSKHHDGIKSTIDRQPSDHAPTLRQIVLSEIEKLPENLREPLLMSYEEDLPAKVIGEKFNIAEGTVRWRLSEGRKMLKDQLLKRLQDAPGLQEILGSLVGAQ